MAAWTKPKRGTVDEYIAGFPPNVRAKLRAVRAAVRKAAPAAKESISYRMPYYSYRGRLVYFAAFRDHYSLFMATPDVVKKFGRRLARYDQSGRGTIRFPYDEPVPAKLIQDIVRFRARENEGRAAARKAKRRAQARKR